MKLLPLKCAKNCIQAVPFNCSAAHSGLEIQTEICFKLSRECLLHFEEQNLPLCHIILIAQQKSLT